MIYKKITYRINPQNVSEIIHYLNEIIIPSNIKNGAKLVGQWVTDSHNDVISIWEYPNQSEFLKIEERVKNDDLYLKAPLDEPPLIEYLEEFMYTTSKYDFPMHSVTVSGYITNEKDETLLVKTFWRSDTWELPGGGVDEGETLDRALYREILEETGIHVKLDGVTGVYSNGSTIAIVFKGKYKSGNVKTSSETKDVQFVKIDQANFTNYITRGKFKPRVLDAMNGRCVPYEAFKVRPYRLLNRFDNDI
ncbi:NUDIX hydrolase [Ferdinandcohnia quinoae]|uniref:NUDIX hydrolase n=1 Tax=Fredinandcohnia quinoae TaxID=2918902 RepID=A0AAW5DZG6_9BACI|nr:NUDIX hydrolase [Fredinandcohnia sp. SECRCQ15]MCH1625468.1 NUDIX hydrolase [Fredinandcohnia sp. SECRCQ15]